MDLRYQVVPGLPNYYLLVESVRLNTGLPMVRTDSHVITKFSRMDRFSLAMGLRSRARVELRYKTLVYEAVMILIQR